MDSTCWLEDWVVRSFGAEASNDTEYDTQDCPKTALIYNVTSPMIEPVVLVGGSKNKSVTYFEPAFQMVLSDCKHMIDAKLTGDCYGKRIKHLLSYAQLKNTTILLTDFELRINCSFDNIYLLINDFEFVQGMQMKINLYNSLIQLSKNPRIQARILKFRRAFNIEMPSFVDKNESLKRQVRMKQLSEKIENELKNGQRNENNNNNNNNDITITSEKSGFTMGAPSLHSAQQSAAMSTYNTYSSSFNENDNNKENENDNENDNDSFEQDLDIDLLEQGGGLSDELPYVKKQGMMDVRVLADEWIDFNDIECDDNENNDNRNNNNESKEKQKEKNQDDIDLDMNENKMKSNLPRRVNNRLQNNNKNRNGSRKKHNFNNRKSCLENSKILRKDNEFAGNSIDWLYHINGEKILLYEYVHRYQIRDSMSLQEKHRRKNEISKIDDTKPRKLEPIAQFYNLNPTIRSGQCEHQTMPQSQEQRLSGNSATQSTQKSDDTWCSALFKEADQTVERFQMQKQQAAAAAQVSIMAIYEEEKNLSIIEKVDRGETIDTSGLTVDDKKLLNKKLIQDAIGFTLQQSCHDIDHTNALRVNKYFLNLKDNLRKKRNGQNDKSVKVDPFKLLQLLD